MFCVTILSIIKLYPKFAEERILYINYVLVGKEWGIFYFICKFSLEWAIVITQNIVNYISKIHDKECFNAIIRTVTDHLNDKIKKIICNRQKS